ncbi:MAG: DUF2490 domain-containing protein [Sphingomonas sp.]|nr:MAG: DUF2490 domain-containing protein [Sphingomonas sp.]
MSTETYAFDCCNVWLLKIVQNLPDEVNHRLGAKGYALFVSHESFILPNSTRWGQLHGYERMRNIVGVTLPFSKLVSADVGYLNQFRIARAGASAQMDHALTVQLTINVAQHHAPKADD